MKGTYKHGDKFAANPHHRGKYFYLGLHDTRKRASLAVRLFNHWVSMGYKPIDIPRDWRPGEASVVIERVPTAKLNNIIRTTGTCEVKHKDLVNMASELLSLRLQHYGASRTEKF